ncbi:MAG: hypothetical protein FH751_03205 [Firmicutes bacterium]|nr:hypothetical protein [Bacillota bacterium]
MLLKRLKLKNFRQYKGDNEINFSTDKDKNVTVILGKNTSGKTTLVQAFTWVLYGVTNFKTKDFLLNLEVANKLKNNEIASVEGTVELIHDGIKYTISRKQDYKCYTTNEVKALQSHLHIQYKDKNGQTKFIKNDLNDTINKILPEDLSSHFFFNGERIANLGNNDRNGKKDLAQAVKGVLGLNTLSKSIDHLSKGYKHSVISRLKNSIDDEGNKELKRLQDKYKSIEKELGDMKERLEKRKDVIQYYKKQKERLEKVILDNKATEHIQEKINTNEKEIKIKEENLENIKKDIVKEFSNKAPMYFMQPLLMRVMKLLEENKELDKGIPEMHADSIDHIIKRGKCICGTKIEKSSNEYLNLMEQKKNLPPHSIGTEIKLFANNASHYQNIAEEFYDSIDNEYKSFRKVKIEISNLESEIENDSKKIENDINVKQKQKEKKEINKEIEELEEEKDELIAEISKLENDIKRVDNKISSLAFASKKNQHIKQCLEYAEYISNKLQNHYKSKEIEIKNKLENRVNEIFNKMYHGNRSIILEDNYKYKLETPELKSDFQSKADASAGLETVTSFAFISGIVDLAREKMSDNGHIEVKSEPYPLVMDAPFSNADDNHIENVSNILPNVAEQVIMFIMHKDWNYAKNVLNSKYNQMYQLNKKRETLTIIEEW